MKAEEGGPEKRPKDSAPREVGRRAAEPDPVQSSSDQGFSDDMRKEEDAQTVSEPVEAGKQRDRFDDLVKDYVARAREGADRQSVLRVYDVDRLSGSGRRVRVVLVEAKPQPVQRSLVLEMMKPRVATDETD